ncbi:MAG: 23S rRNA (pseudouridine(1915)-N(3))-methyltransferase RlmH [Betaproteobacteria bacterium]|nr:23S rRNA (pseudouridine(1915)-N(3))-methyltransferase RlmH [Betaproteobacteria bacterium]
MARLHVLALDARLPAWAEAACAEYARRMPKGYEVSRVSLRNPDLGRLFSEYRRVVALDERGEDLTTVQFARLLAQETAFVIGPADGLPEEFKAKAAMKLRLSSLTLAHALAQVVLLEQLYRAATLLSGHPYHRS